MANSKTSLNGYEYGRNPKTTAPFWAGSGEGASIDDTGVYTDKTWSSKKISDELAKKAEASDLANYAKVTSVYTKTQTYTKEEVNKLLENIPSVDGYTKTEVNTLLADKADKSDTYTKSQVNNLIPDVSGLATKTELNSGLATKANSDDVYSKTQTYTKTEVDNLIADIPAVDAYTKKQTDTLLADKANVSDLANYAKTTSVYMKSQTYTKTEVDNLISGAGGGGAEIDDTAIVNNKTWSSMKINRFNGVKRFILKPYEVAPEKMGYSKAFTHISYKLKIFTTNWESKLPLIITKADGATAKIEIPADYTLLPWNENETNSEYPKDDAIYRKFSIGGMDLGVCFTGNHVINERYLPDIVIAVDASLGISSIAFDTTDYGLQAYAVDYPYSNYTPEALYKDYSAYTLKDEVINKNEADLIKYENGDFKYYEGNAWHSCLTDESDDEDYIHLDSGIGTVISCNRFGNQFEFIIKLDSGFQVDTANTMRHIGECRAPVGPQNTKINGFVYDDSTYFNLADAGCIIMKTTADATKANIYFGCKSAYTTNGNEIIRFSYLIPDE